MTAKSILPTLYASLTSWQQINLDYYKPAYKDKGGDNSLPLSVLLPEVFLVNSAAPCLLKKELRLVSRQTAISVLALKVKRLFILKQVQR